MQRPRFVGTPSFVSHSALVALGGPVGVQGFGRALPQYFLPPSALILQAKRRPEICDSPTQIVASFVHSFVHFP
jgi:hypothetical protein